MSPRGNLQTIARIYDRFCTRRFPKTTEKEVEALERRLQSPLPQHYREYLLEFNGGEFSEPLIRPPTDDCPECCLEFMHGIQAPHPIQESGRPATLALWEDNDPPVVLPIGQTTEAYYIVVVLEEGDDYAQVLMRTYQEFFFLAGNMREFFGLLEPYEG